MSEHRTPVSLLSARPLPIPPPRARSATAELGSVAPAAVLLLESDADDARQVLGALGEFESQFHTEWVESLRSAVDALVDADFDCLIIGLGLPDAEGLELVEVLRDVADRAALIVMTDGDDALLGFRAIQGGVDGYLVRSELASNDSRDLCLAVQYAIERARLKTNLREAENMARTLSAIVESTADAILTKSSKGIIRTWNQGAEELYGYSRAEVVGQHVDLLHPWDAIESTQILSSVVEGQTVRGLETVHRTKAGVLVPVSLTVSPLTGDREEHLGASVIARDISDRRLLEEKLTKQAMHDALTGLPNRVLLLDRLEQALADAGRSGQPVATLFLDLDDFKKVNDSNGHLAGDQLLIQVAASLRRVVRPADTVARLGGDEFVLVCRNTGTSEAEGVARRIKETLAHAVSVDGQAFPVTASVGIAVCPPVGPEPELLLQAADAAMYEAKARGRDCATLFDASLAAHSHRRQELVDDLRTVLGSDLGGDPGSDQLELHYQPIIDIPSGRLVGVEALARWTHPERGSIPPALFVPLAEEVGLVARLDTWVIQRACRDAVRLRARGVLSPDARMAVNVSARTVGKPHLGRLVDEIATAHDLPAEALVVEVTETAVMQDPTAARSSLDALRRIGVGVALDDFGTGYSSLTNLRQMPASHLKIDRSFVSQITDEAQDRAIAACIIDLAHKLGMEVIAEGVETAEQLAVLDRLGCTTGQGYLWSRPVPMEELSHIVRPEAAADPA